MFRRLFFHSYWFPLNLFFEPEKWISWGRRHIEQLFFCENNGNRRKNKPRFCYYFGCKSAFNMTILQISLSWNSSFSYEIHSHSRSNNESEATFVNMFCPNTKQPNPWQMQLHNKNSRWIAQYSALRVFESHFIQPKHSLHSE